MLLVKSGAAFGAVKCYVSQAGKISVSFAGLILWLWVDRKCERNEFG